MKENFFQFRLNHLYCQYFTIIWFKDNDSKIENSNLKNVFINSLTRSFFINLAALIDPVKNGGFKNLTIRTLKDPLDEKYGDIVSKVQTIRNKLIGHNDDDTYGNIESFLNDINLTYENTKEILDYLVSIVEEKENLTFNDLKEKLKKEIYQGLENLFTRKPSN